MSTNDNTTFFSCIFVGSIDKYLLIFLKILESERILVAVERRSDGRQVQYPQYNPFGGASHQSIGEILKTAQLIYENGKFAQHTQGMVDLLTGKEHCW